MPTATEPIKILLIEDNPGDARLVRETLVSARSASFEVESLDRLASGVERLRRAGIDVVLLDLSLPDSQGMETIARLHTEAPDIPIIALSGMDDQSIIQDAVKQGAEDYLVKGAFSTDILVRSIHYAIDRRRVHDDLARARDSALESARVRSEFLANMSHEIRTPLNGVVGMTRLLVDTPLTTDQQEMLEIARMSADSLLKIVNDILDFSKISAGKVVLEDANFDLGAAVESVVRIFAEQAHAKGLVLDSFVDGNVQMRLRGDAGRLCQVLTNLVGNAVKFTAEGEATVRVEQIGESEDQSTLRFQVRDTGIGIPLDGQRNIFQAFTQADGSTTRRFGGTGLGLAISAQLVELMGGRIGVESESGGGSTFWFTAKFGRQAAGAVRDTSQDHLRLERVRVLIVDGNATSARVVSDHLQAWRMRCEIVTGAAQALDALTRMRAAGDPFEIAIIDLQLPEHDGLDLARAIKDMPRLAGVRVLGIYALGSRPDKALTKAAGIRALLGKPVKQSQLFNTLSTLMEVRAEAPPEPQRGVRPAREIKSVIPAEIRQRTRILLVEDNLVNQQVEMRMIARIGYQAERADNGRIALEKLALTDFDIILMDCQMPEVDGYTATREIRRREGAARHIPIIGVTAHALAGDREECLRAGMDDYIAKPVMPEDLAAMIDKWVRIATPQTPVTQLHPASADAAAQTPVTQLYPFPADAAAQTPDKGAQPPLAPVIDEAVLAELREYQNPGEPDFVTELIGIFTEDLTDRLAQINAGLQAGDASRVRRAAHALKGASGELGAQRMHEICSRMELSAAVGSIAVAPAMFRELKAEAIHVRAALETHCVKIIPARTPASEA
jgi:two-component system, sensor histidine kinase and response regulator